MTVTGKTEVSTSIPPTPHHPGYAPNAAFHAIKRHALEFVNPKELMVSCKTFRNIKICARRHGVYRFLFVFSLYTFKTNLNEYLT